MTIETAKTLSPADARELLVRALWFSRQPSFAVPTEEDEARSRWRGSDDHRLDSTKIELLRAATAFAGYAGEPALLPLVVEALSACDHAAFEREDNGQIEIFSDTIRWLLRLGGSVTPAVRALADHPQAAIRVALVQGLSEAAAEFEPLLRPLADDEDPRVRRAVKEALLSLGQPPWWAGMFTSDPALLVSPEEGPRVGQLLARWAELLDQPHGVYGEAREELYAILDQLPDVLARDAACRLIVAEGHHDHLRLARRLARIPDAIEAVIALSLRDESYRLQRFLEAFAQSAASEPAAEAWARRALEAALGRASAERSDVLSPTWMLADLGLHLWPAEADPSDLVERVFRELASTGERLDVIVSTIGQVAAKSARCVATWRDRAVEAFLSGEDRAIWRALFHLRDAALAGLPLEERRQAARRALGSPDDTVARWGLEQLTGAAHDPTRDPPVHELAEALSADRRVSDLMAGLPALARSHRDLLLLRLHRGELSLEASCSLLGHLSRDGEQMSHAFVGGSRERRSRPVPEPEVALTAEDWAAWRRLRDAPGARMEGWHVALFALPSGPLCAADRAFVERALGAIRAGDDRPILGVAVALMEGGSADDLPILDELIRRDGDDTMTDLRKRMKKRLGLTGPRRGRRAPEARPADAPPREWMDEED